MNDEPASPPRGRPARLGLWLGGIYFLTAAAVFTLTALTTRPDKVGYDWIPFYLLAWPWSSLGGVFAIVGVLLNAVILWALGTSAQRILRDLRED